MLPNPGGSSVGSGAYDIIGQESTVQTDGSGKTVDIEQITFRSLKYDVVATFNVLSSTYEADGAAGLVSEKTAQLEQLCAIDHVVGARGAPDQDPRSGLLFNYLVLTVGTPDYARTSEVWVRMDHLGLPAAFAAVDQAWATMQALGPSGQITV